MLFTASLAPWQPVRHPHQRSAKPRRSPAILKVRATGEVLRLVKNLRAQGASVALTNDKVSQPFFSGASRIISVNGQVVQLFEYAQVSKANSEAKRVSPNGMTIGTSKPSWLSTPHFFKTEKLIVLYVGDDQTILRVLQAGLGRQFAGG
jgi:aconitase B